MQVRIDGQLRERRPYIAHEQTGDRSGFGYSLPREEPELEDGELAIWVLGDPVPTIVRTFDPA